MTTTPRHQATIMEDIARQLAASQDLDPSRFASRFRREAEDLVVQWRMNPAVPTCQLEALCQEIIDSEAAEQAARRARSEQRLAMHRAAHPEPVYDPAKRRILVHDQSTGTSFWLTVAVENLEPVSRSPVHAGRSELGMKGRPVTEVDTFGKVISAAPTSTN